MNDFLLTRKSDLSSVSEPPSQDYVLEAPERTFGLRVVQTEDEMTHNLLMIGEREAQMGQLAVEAGAAIIDKDEEMRLRDDISSLAAEHFGASFEYEDAIADVREAIEGLDAVGRQELDDYLSQSASPFLVDAKNQYVGPEIPWATWLATRASDEAVTNVLQWHAYSMGEQVVDPDIRMAIREGKERFKLLAFAMVNTGRLAPRALEAVKRLDNLPIGVSDVFDTRLKGRNAYYAPHTDRVSISQGVGRAIGLRRASFQEHIDDTLFHELNHAVIATNVDREGSAMSARWLDEALTEVIASSMKRRETRDATVSKEVYVPEKGVLFTLLAGPQRKAEIRSDEDRRRMVAEQLRLATFAYSGDKSDEELWLWNLDQSWGYDDVIQKVSSAIDEYTVMFMEGASDEREAMVDALYAVLSRLGSDSEALLG